MKTGDLPLLLLSIPEVCQAAKLGRSKIYDLIRAKELLVVKCGRRTLIRYSDFQDFIENLSNRKKSEVGND